MAGFGIKHFVSVEKIGIFDMIPVDIVSNSILVTSAHCLQMSPGQTFIYHAASSNLNAMKLDKSMDSVTQAYNKIRLDKNQGKVWAKLIKNP